MANTYVDYTATAGQTDFAFSFPFLEDSHVVVEVDGVNQALTTNYTIETSPAQKIVLSNPTTAIAGGELVRVKRVSDPSTDLVDFENGSVLTETELDRAYRHNRYLAEEAYDGVNAGLGELEGSTNYNANNKQIKNLADGTLATDAVNKGYVDTQIALTDTNLAGFFKSTHTGNAVDNVFTLSFTPQTTEAEAYIVSIDGLVQVPDTDYTIGATAITFNTIPANSAEICVVATAASSVATANEAQVTATGSTTARSLADRFADVVNVLDYEADNTGANDAKPAIQAALNSGGKMVYVPAGTYKLDSNLSVPQGVSIKGDGQGSTVFDASAIDYTTLPSGSSIIEVAEITPTAIPDLASDVSINDKEITLASSPSVEVGDIVLIYNPNDSSWNSDRVDYRAGEYLKVSAVSGSTLRFEGSIVDDYLVADVDLYKMDMGYCSMTGFTIKCKADAQTSSTRGLTLNHCKHSVIRDVEVITAPYIGIGLSRCFDVTVDNCRATDNFAETLGEYGLIVGNSTYVTIKDCHLCSNRHGLSTGGADGIGYITNRFLNYINNHVSTTGNVHALDIHGNTEYVNVSNNIIDGGMDFGGDYINISNNTIMGKTVNGSALLFTELKGFHISITGNTIKSNHQDGDRGNLIDCGGNGSPYSANSDRGGVLQISDNTLIYDAPLDTGDDEYSVIVVANRGYNGAENASVTVQSNTLSVVNEPSDPNYFVDDFLKLRAFSGKSWHLVSIENNTGAGGIKVFEDGSGFSCRTLSITNNNLRNGENIFIEEVEETCNIVGNNFESFKLDLAVLGDSTNLTNTVRISDNVINDCMWGRNSANSQNDAIRCWRAVNAYVANNFITGANEKLKTNGLPSSPAFELGETITGGISGATAVVYDTSSDFLLIKDSASGTFTNGEIITGGSSGATATLFASSAQASTKNYSRSFNTITNLYTGGNADTELATEYKNAITNDVAL
jgi:hypothetical protein